MPGQTESLDAAALTPIFFAAIYLYVRVIVVWIVCRADRYAERAAGPTRDPRSATRPGSSQLPPRAEDA